MKQIKTKPQIETSEKAKENKFFQFLIAKRALCQKLFLVVFGFLTIFMFIMLMMPSRAGHSQLYFTNQTAFYAVKYSSDFQTYYISLTPAGIILIILNIFALAFFITVIVVNRQSLKQFYKDIPSKNELKKRAILDSFIYLGLFLTFVLLFIFILIPPNFAKSAKYYYMESLQTSISSLNQDDLVAALTKLGVTEIGGIAITDSTMTIGILYTKLQDILSNYQGVFAFTPFTLFSAGVVVFSNGMYAIIVIFCLFFCLSMSSSFANYILNKGFNWNFKLNKETLSMIRQKIKEKQDYKREINRTKKELLNKENELLKDLHEVNLDKVSQEQKMGLISQEELEKLISKNNEIKKQLEELVAKKAEIDKQRISNSKLKTALNKIQSKSNSKTDATRKDKKQTITIPDKELDEIFRNLDLD